ncbi:MAG: helix-turn-helix transcriptional regulator [Lentisphaerota bacterium]
MTDKELIKTSRKMLNLNQGPFAALIGVSIQAVQSWELGRRNPKPEAFRAILDAIVTRTVSAASRQAFINDTVEKLKEKAKES